MSYRVQKCQECGTPYSSWSNFCANCGCKLEPLPPPEEVLDGFPRSEWCDFIDKNS